MDLFGELLIKTVLSIHLCWANDTTMQVRMCQIVHYMPIKIDESELFKFCLIIYNMPKPLNLLKGEEFNCRNHP